MNTFRSARLTLTAWYVIISMTITIFFSLIIYFGIVIQIDRIAQGQEFIEQNNIQITLPKDSQLPPVVDEKFVQSVKERIILVLIIVNGGVFGLAGGAGYILAGRTLRPIKETIELQNRFITDASHELKTPLTTIRTEFEVAMLEKNISTKQAKKLIKSSYEEILNLQVLTENLLELTRQQKKRGHLQLEEVALLEITEVALKKVIPLAKQKNIIINNDVDDYVLRGEQQSLIQLFVILLDNAIKYSTTNSEITLTSRKTDHYLVINVSDQGIGIAKKDTEHIFERFYRADRSRSQTTGYGLGLSIAKEIVESHNGVLSVDSEIDHGTTFIIRLPLTTV